MRNRLLSALLACVFILSLLPMSAFAADTLEIAASEATVVDGAADVTISFPSNPGMMSISMAVKYPEGLELTGVDDAKLLKNGVLQNTFKSPFTLTFGDDLSSENDTSTGVIATLHFKVTDSGAAAPYAIEIVDVTVIDVDMADVAYTVKNGSVTTSSGGSSGGTNSGDSVVTYTVKYDANGGSGSIPDAKVNQGNKLTLPANSFTAPAGKQFKAWDVNGTEYQPSAQVDIAADTTVKAVWEDAVPVDPNSLQIAASQTPLSADNTADVTISFPFNPGMMSISMAVKYPEGLELTGADDAKLLKNGVLQNTFTSPFTLTFGDDLSSENDTSTGVIATLHFKATDSGAAAPYAIEIVDVTVIDVDMEDVAYTVKNGSVTTSSSDSPDATAYTVKFDANGGTKTMSDVTVNQGQKLKLPENGFDAPTGKQFKAWDVNGTEYQPGNEVDITANNTTVKAVWEDIPAVTYTVKFDANGGSKTMSDVTVNQGQKLKLPENGFDAPAGKQFKAWDVNGTEYQPGTEVDITADNTTVKAVWEDIPATSNDEYTVKFDANGGSGSIPDATVKRGEKLTLPTSDFEAPAGKQFKAWSVNGREYQPEEQVDITANNTTVKAVWEDIPEGGCYVATAVYGSYDCPEVWTLRRFRDDVLAQTWYGRLFIKAYYAVSPTCVRLFGDTEIFQNFFRGVLDPWVAELQADGFEDTPYNDIDW